MSKTSALRVVGDDATTTAIPNDLQAFWMPFTANRLVQEEPAVAGPRQGRALLDAGRPQGDRRHGRPVVRQCRPLAARIDRGRDCPSSSSEMDYAPSFQMGHPKAFELAAPPCGHAAGRPRPRVLLQLGVRGGRLRAQDRAGLAAGARPGHTHPADWPRARLSRCRLRRHLGRRHRRPTASNGASCWPGVDHMPHTHLPAKNAFSRGLPDHGGVELADELERIVALHDASTIAAVIVEPCAGSTGVPAAARATWSACARSATSTASC